MNSRADLFPIDEAEVAITVDQAARLLGCDPSTVRKLLRNRKLAGNRVGLGDRPNGIRVHLESVRAYKRRHAIGAAIEDAEPTPKPRGRRQINPAAQEALRELRAMGVLV